MAKYPLRPRSCTRVWTPGSTTSSTAQLTEERFVVRQRVIEERRQAELDRDPPISVSGALHVFADGVVFVSVDGSVFDDHARLGQHRIGGEVGEFLGEIEDRGGGPADELI